MAVKKIYAVVLCWLTAVAGLTTAAIAGADDHHYEKVERVVAIGDLHGDYEQYIRVMEAAGVLDRKGRWAGGRTHLVQSGDITDRGADSRKIIDHLVKLAKTAQRKGGRVHMLIGNHEAMNVTGDLRYVSPGEFQSYQTRNSARLQEAQWQAQLNWMQANTPDLGQMDLAAYRQQWERRVPLGWVEHRQAWMPGGDYFAWTRGNRVAVMIDGTIFLHGGISAKYCHLDLSELTRQVGEALDAYDPAVPSIADDPLGPLWYRGLVTEDEGGVFSQTLDNILERYGARRIVVGHTPTGGVVWPRFDGRVVANDTGISTQYGAHIGILELTDAGAVAIYGKHRIPLPESNESRVDYLQAVIGVDANNAQMKQRLAEILAPPAEPAPGEVGTEPAPAVGQQQEALIPGTCR